MQSSGKLDNKIVSKNGAPSLKKWQKNMVSKEEMANTVNKGKKLPY